MTDKTVHVKSYVKDDGTKVREHYRGVGSNTAENDVSDNMGQEEYNYSNPFEIGISIDEQITPQEDLPENSEAENPQKQQKTHPIIDKAKECINTILQKMKLKKAKAAEIYEALDKIQAGQQEAIIREQLTLDYLSKIKNQTEYQKVYKQYIALRRLNREMNESMARLKYLNNQNNIEGVVNELENMNTNFDEVKKQIKEMNPLPKDNPAIIERNIPEYSSWQSKHMKKIVDATKQYDTPKIAVDIGMKLQNIDNSMPDAAKLWKAASNDFRNSKEYITKNGALIYNIYDLPSKELQDIVQKKVQGQLGVSNANGIILNSTSDLAKEISTSRELKDYYLKHKDNLQKGKVVKDESTYLGSSQNMAKSIGHADIVYSYIDKQGDLNSVILDTYDFNKNDSDWKVQIARQSQDLRTIRNYYEIIITKTPKSVLEQW